METNHSHINHHNLRLCTAHFLSHNFEFSNQRSLLPFVFLLHFVGFWFHCRSSLPSFFKVSISVRLLFSFVFIVTGLWGDKAYKEATKYCNAKVIHSGKSEEYTSIPSYIDLKQSDSARYEILVADMSSNFCSKLVDLSRFGVIYAGAQKNVGPSGVTIVIIRNDLIGNAQPITPVMLDYKIHVENFD